MSTLRIRFRTQPLDFSPLTRGTVTVRFNDNSRDYDLVMHLTTGLATTYRFQEVPWLGGALEEGQHAQQCANFAASFNRDYSTIGATSGGTGPFAGKNLFATVVSDNGYPEVLITATNGTFDESECDYSGNVLVVGPFEDNNTPQSQPLSLSYGITSTGNCSTIVYNLSASGGSAPYSVSSEGATLISGWDGSTSPVSLSRGGLRQLTITDSLGATYSTTPNVPRNLAIGEFQENITQRENDADVTIQTLVSVAGTAPLEYAINNDVGGVFGTDYQTSNSFPGILSGQYKLWIKDKYGCEISKIINISGNVNSDETTTPLYFEFPEGQSLIATESVDFNENKGKNYFNTMSVAQISDTKYQMKLFFVNTDVIGAQFKSSYPYHYITLHKCNGQKVDLPSIMIQENLGVAEKFDCVLFPINGQTGVYFNGGNEYAASSTDVIGDSPYNKTTPPWNNVGQVVSIEGVGSFEILSSGYDENRGGYFVVDTITAAETPSKVQAIYNAQEYNLFEFYFSASLIDEKAVIIIEKAFSNDGNVEGNPWVVENISIVPFNENLLTFEWFDSKNKGGIVFQSGIVFKKRCFGEFNPMWSDEAETYKGDSAEYSLKQTSYTDFEILVEGINQKEITQLNIASGLDGFKCNGLLLVRKKPPETKRLGKSNLYTWKCEFAHGQNNLAIKQDEIVLNVGTGVVGGGGSGTNPAPDLSGIQLYKDTDGNLITFNGKLGKVIA